MPFKFDETNKYFDIVEGNPKKFEKKDIYMFENDKSRILPLESHTQENDDIIYHLFDGNILGKDGSSLVQKKEFEDVTNEQISQQATIIAKKFKEKLKSKRNETYKENTDKREKNYTTTSGGFATRLPDFKYMAFKIIYTSNNYMVISALNEYLNLEFYTYKSIDLEDSNISNLLCYTATQLEA